MHKSSASSVSSSSNNNNNNSNTNNNPSKHPEDGLLLGKSPLSVQTAETPHPSGELLLLSDSKESESKCPSGPSVAGVLYKWVNYGKRWRMRWFVLQEGVLSYYKLHGAHKIVLSPGIPKGSKVIGDKSQRLLKKLKVVRSGFFKNHKGYGKLHLKVSTIRDSKSDDKKFYIFTGTKTLHLRAETREDRVHWIEALQNAKELLPPGLTSSDLALSLEEITISTEKLKSFLLNQGLNPEIVGESEKIMLSECSGLKDQIKLLQQSRIGLLDRLRQLEAEKIELETTVIDETQSNANGGNESRGIGGYKDWEASGTESDESADKPDGGDGESDEDDEIYFDTKEGSYHRSQGDLAGSFSDGDRISVSSSPRQEFGEHVSVELIEFDYPHVKRRTRLPEPKEKEKSVSLWSLIKDNIGKDLTRVCLPVYFNEPISSLQKCYEDMEYSYLLDRAYIWGKKGNSLMRVLSVAAFAVSGYASTEGRTCKPFNPLLGETYEADYSDKGLRFISEKVSHHPMIIACHCEGRGWKFWGDSMVKSKFWGRSIQLDPVGVLTLEFDDGEVFQWSKVTTSIYNLILGKLYCDHYGAMRVQGNQELSCKLKFKEQSIIDRNPHQVQGFVHDSSGNKLATLFGKWDESMYFVNGDITAKPKGYDPMSEAILLWKRSSPPENPTRYNLTSFAITANELIPGLKEILPPTDSRLRPDQRYLENGEYENAFSEKLRLEQKQRQAQRLQETGWQPRWFSKEKGQESYKYNGGYWEAREKGKWVGCADIFSTATLDFSK